VCLGIFRARSAKAKHHVYSRSVHLAMKEKRGCSVCVAGGKTGGECKARTVYTPAACIRR
jgi:hypothetical protein